MSFSVFLPIHSRLPNLSVLWLSLLRGPIQPTANSVYSLGCWMGVSNLTCPPSLLASSHPLNHTSSGRAGLFFQVLSPIPCSNRWLLSSHFPQLIYKQITCLHYLSLPPELGRWGQPPSFLDWVIPFAPEQAFLFLSLTPPFRQDLPRTTETVPWGKVILEIGYTGDRQLRRQIGPGGSPEIINSKPLRPPGDSRGGGKRWCYPHPGTRVTLKEAASEGGPFGRR